MTDAEIDKISAHGAAFADELQALMQRHAVTHIACARPDGVHFDMTDHAVRLTMTPASGWAAYWIQRAGADGDVPACHMTTTPPDSRAAATAHLEATERDI